MTTRAIPWPDGAPAWFDIMVPDPRKAMDFYGALFGWDFADQGDDAGHYLLCSVGGGQVAGIGATPPGREIPVAWTVYLATSDVEKRVAAVTEHGARLLMPPTDVTDQGRMALAADPTGAVFGLWQAGAHPGAELSDVAGAYVWAEIITRDYARAKDFYAGAFGHGHDEMSDAAGSEYAAFTVDGSVAGGIGGMSPDAPAEVPPHWTVYFGVFDTDAAVVRVEELGGQLVREPADSPYGRTATVTDNQGAYFQVVSADEAR